MKAVLLDMVPDRVQRLLGSRSGVCLLNGKDVFNGLRDSGTIIMACNPRIKHVIPGVMAAAEELDAVVAFELTRSEGGLDGGYTGFTPELFVTTILQYAEEIGFSKPFVIHGDHITVKSTAETEIASAAELIAVELQAGYTSFALDASFNSLDDNTRITAHLAQPIISSGLGLEVEVGEIKRVGARSKLTTVAETEEFLSGLASHGVTPQLLAMDNGSKSGNYLEGEPVAINLERTREIYSVARKHGLAGLVQHGITGTPLHVVGRLADYGIRKGNIGTLWQNIAHAGLPFELMDTMRRWARENGAEIKLATGVFRTEIDAIPSANRQRIRDLARHEARELLTAFRAAGSATQLATVLSGS